MEGLRVSKLEEGQQWGKNTSSKDQVQRGRRPPFIGGGKSNRYPPLSPAESGTTAWPAVLPLPLAVLPLGPEWYYRGGQGGTTAYERYYGPHCRG